MDSFKKKLTMLVAGFQGRQRMVLDNLKLELQKTISHLMSVLETELGSSTRICVPSLLSHLSRPPKHLSLHHTLVMLSDLGIETLIAKDDAETHNWSKYQLHLKGLLIAWSK